MIEIKEIAAMIENARDTNGRIYVCGNGGSAANAEHLVCDLVKAGFPAFSLVSNTALITALANDYGYEFVFSQQLKACLKDTDLVIAFTTSGESENIIKALEYANEVQAGTLVFTGGGANRAREIADHTRATQLVHDVGVTENMHLTWIHLLMQEL